MVNRFISQITAGLLLAAALSNAATHGTIKDGQGRPVAGALVVAEGTDLADVTDAEGHFELSTVNIRSNPQWRQHLKIASIEVDAMGRLRQAAQPGQRQARLAILQAPLTPSTSTNPEPVAARKAAANDPTHLLVAHEDHFASAAAFNPASSAPLNLMLEKVEEFAKTNEVNPASADFKVLEVTDSTMLVVDTSSRENVVCKAGKPVFLPDTSYSFYKIMGKTMYQWDESMIEEGDYTATVFTRSTGSLFGTWNMLGMGQAPVSLPDDAPMEQDAIDSLLDMQRGILKVAGTMTFGQTQASIDVQYGVCMGYMMASVFQMPPITATAKSCTEVELKNGNSTATWSFVFKNDSTYTSFTYNGATCTDNFASDAEPTFDCTELADGEVPEETTEDPTDGGMNSLANCPGFISFFTGGIDIPEIPISPLGKKSASTIEASSASIALDKASQLQRNVLKKLPRALR
jgi:hypothetical protein